MKKVLIVLVLVLVAYFSYKAFMMPNDEQVLENTLKEMTALDEKDAQSDVSEKDVMFEDEKMQAAADTTMKKAPAPTQTTNTEASANIDAALADMSSFSSTEGSDPFDGL